MTKTKNHPDMDQSTSVSPSGTHPKTQKRPTCPTCRFPPRTCVCPALPTAPLHTLFRRCRILLLQHPHELRRKNRSLPLVHLCLFGGHHHHARIEDVASSLNPQDFVIKTIVGRSLQPHRDAAILDLLSDPEQVVVVVFPHRNAMELERGIRLAEERCGTMATSDNDDNDEECEGSVKAETTKKKITLVFIDATWKHAREMEAKLSKSVECCRHWIRVQLVPTVAGGGGDARVPVVVDYKQSSTLTETTKDASLRTTTVTTTTHPFVPRRFQIRAPPSPNHLSTAECLAWVASRVERNPVILERIRHVLDYMVFLWRVHVVDVDKAQCGKSRGGDVMSQKTLEIAVMESE
ncbi:hypothetical protein HJC23_003342 [Cyclotella cryptica]|uniref:tRNA-uridine aminocarboxypropyltransferase n=1 Tax=Cyclotella cryptica TaxID=29204 RepID=A0ABD3QY14_9STRA|eukprot:CCRYP_000911-RB/>CCRYP_000911-RB protein AED:0.02 eAED:0.02 QI:55/-1/1/1/-1/1/1/46/349